MSGEGLDPGGIARHEQDGRVLSGGSDAGKLAETMERHAPPEPKTPAGPAVPAAEGGEPAGTPAAQQEPKQTRGQQRFSELAKARDAEKARADAAEARAKELEARVATPAPAAKVEPATEPAKVVEAPPVNDPKDPEPQEADFDDYRQFVKALSKWEIRQDRRESEAVTAAAEQQKAETARAAAEKTALDTWASRRDAYAAKDPSFMAKALPLLERLESGTMLGDAIIESEFGPQIALHLATHPEEVQRIAGMSVNSALRAIGKIEASFESPAVKPATRAHTPPPAPYVPVNGSTPTASTPSAELAKKGNFDAYRAKRAQERGVKPRY